MCFNGLFHYLSRGRFGMICGHFSLWLFSLWPFWFVAIMEVDRECNTPSRNKPHFR